MWSWQTTPLLLALCTLSATASAETLTISVEDAAPPWSIRDGTGFANDVVIAAFKEMSVSVQLNVMPYARCKYMALNGTTVACFNMSGVPEFEGKIRLASLPIYSASNDIFERIDDPLPKPPDGKCTLPPGSVGISRAYEYSSEATALQSSNVVFESAASDVQNLEKLAAGRLKAALIITSQWQDRSEKARRSGTETAVRFSFNCGRTNVGIGFSLAHPDGLRALEMYDEGYRRIQANGVLEQIYHRWFTAANHRS
ncbi:transporter substrate-binding domain-containing protein [Pseudomonas sp. PP3]|uniref:substrate-binding periplasmic protein n=1 Tax=Pseudomonas sp. PP3 TaxID=2815936 RepID=UPI001BB07FE4|nr:transporter substrate-binding domain-containing protein [Pseudomonas sp. PP3]